jgi:ATP-binding cassette, subfamily B, multidrug efflux pump
MKKLLLTYLRPYRGRIVLIFFLVLLQSIGNLYLPTLNADIINEGVVKGDTDYILRTGLIMLGVALLITICSVTSVYHASKAAMGMGRDVRGALYRKVESLSQSEMGRFGTPSLITRNTNDVQQVQMLAAIGLTLMVMAPMMAIGGIIMALRQDVSLSAALAVILPLMGVFMFVVLRRAIPLFRTIQARIDRINQIMRETLSGVRVIRAFARMDYEERRFGEANQDLTDTTVRVFKLFSLVFPILFLIMNLSTVAIMWFGGQRVDSGEMPIGNLFAFIAYVMQILFAVLMSVMLAAMVPRAVASGGRIQDVLDVEPAIHDPSEPVVLRSEAGKRGLVEFRDVEFRYPGAQDAILSNISFVARPGETTAIVGSTGSGKSTLIGLIPRLNDVTGGSILIDGVDIREMDRADLWSHIGFVPQKAFLFSGTVASNLRYGGPEATDEELWRALRIAQAEEFVSAMAEKLDEPITQGGTNVSGGQRQRLAIARALVKRPDIYVFDDSFSALDLKTDSMLRAALKRETGGATVIVVAQRVSTILHADRIVVLEEGGICGIGHHEDLIDRCETYREIVYSQLTAEEVA